MTSATVTSYAETVSIEALASPITVTSVPTDASQDGTTYSVTTGFDGYAWSGDLSNNYYKSITMTYSVAADSNVLQKGLSLVLNGGSIGWQAVSNYWITAGDDQTLTIDLSTFAAGSTTSFIGYQVSNMPNNTDAISGLTIESLTIEMAVPALPANEYALGTGQASSWGQAVIAGVGEDIGGTDTCNDAHSIAIHPETLTDEFAVSVAFTGSNPTLALQGSGDGHNWVQITPDVIINGVAYFTYASISAAYGSDFSDCTHFFINEGTGGTVTVTSSTLYTTVPVPTPTYAINIADTENGSVVATVDGAAATEAEEGATVTLEITPDAGYEVDTIIASNDNGENFVADFVSESNTFVMPAENVTIKVTFMPIEVQSVDVTPENVTLVVGDSIQLVAEVTPTDALDQTLTWSSDEPTIASVDQNGKVTALEEGFAVITAEASNGVLNTVTVNVTADSVPATAIELISTELDTVVGDMNNIGAGLSIEPADCTDVPVWETSDPDVATVTADGKVTSVGAGSATITVTVGSLTATCVVNVEEPAPEPSGFDLTEPEFIPSTTVMQTAIEEDGEQSLRFVCLTSEDNIEDISQVNFNLHLYVDGTYYGATTISSEYYYTSLVASGETVTAPEGYIFLSITINNVPANCDISCGAITLS